MPYFKELLAGGIFILWAYMVIKHPDDPMIVGAMIGLMTGSVAGYYFGTTKTGSETAAKNADAVTQALGRAGETVPVTVVNGTNEPVPVEAK